MTFFFWLRDLINDDIAAVNDLTYHLHWQAFYIACRKQDLSKLNPFPVGRWTGTERK